ncbi:MAG: Asp23/Gls24 family envelope stress response protein [Firmicutes bacterium]|nr:Asp23/Gls24 family envelope stress response protein [Bacillota bacterium]
MNNEYGNIKVTDETIAICAAKVALETQGVFSLASAITDTISENILRKSPEARGVKIYQNEDKIVIDLSVIINYGVKIPSVAWNIQENVKREVEAMTGLEVNFVNIYVQGIHFDDN